MLLTTSVAIAAISFGLPNSALPPMPSGMELLYGTRIGIHQNRDPVVPIGLMDGQDKLSFHSTNLMQLDYFENNILKTTKVGPNLQVDITIERSRAASREHYVDLEGVEWDEEEKIDEIIHKWTDRGFKEIKALKEGTVYGLAGTVIDNRAYRIVLGAKNAAQANSLTLKIFKKWKHRAQVRSRITQRPWAKLGLTVDGFRVATATSYIRLQSMQENGLITVRSVEFGKGYKWGGHEDRTYRGSLYGVVDPNGKLAAVNVVNVEAVLAGVVPSELFASAHPEALKAQAVAARTILFAQLGRRHYADPFHLCSSQHCQVYGGASHEDIRTTNAVNATSGELLFHNKRLINATYSSTCGGFTEHNHSVWRNQPSHVLRGKPDFPIDEATLAEFKNGIDTALLTKWLNIMPNSYCHRAPQAQADKIRWSREFDSKELNQLVSKRYPALGKLKDIQVMNRGISGRAISLRLVGDLDARIVLYELPIRRLFNNLRSGAFIVDLEREAGFITKAVFKGAGWGHGVGMCQLGAIGRAEASHSYREILSHYYNGAKLRRLYRPKHALLKQEHVPH